MSPSDSTIVIANQPMKVRLGAHRGRVVVDIRYHYRAKLDGRLLPTRRGITLHAGAIDELIEALARLREQMIRDGALEVTGGTTAAKFHPERYPADF